jgi:hypothetical protein
MSDVIEPDVVALLESGCATFVGTVDADGIPAAAHAMGIQVLDGGARLRVVLNAEETEVLDNLGSTGVVALGATDVSTLRSVQVKGRAELVEPVNSADRIRKDAYISEFFRLVHETDGAEIELLHRLVPREFLALVMTVDELFDQTPGPQAGVRLGRS